MPPIIVDNEARVRTLINLLVDCLREERNQLLFMDLEGVDLSRHGTLAIMQLLMPPNPIVYLIDIHVLGSQAFEYTDDDGNSLRSMLESNTILKVFFDIRNDSDALHGLFGINLGGIIDLQILEYATRQPRGKFVNGLSRCVDNDLPHIPGWAQTKYDGRQLFAPEAGGRYEVFLDRPIPSKIISYCEEDVMLMPQLLAKYGPRLLHGVAAQIQGIVDGRVHLSKTPGYNGKGKHMAVGPILAPARQSANSSLSLELKVVCSSELESLCHLSDTASINVLEQFDVVQVDQEIPEVSENTSST